MRVHGTHVDILQGDSKAKHGEPKLRVKKINPVTYLIGTSRTIERPGLIARLT